MTPDERRLLRMLAVEIDRFSEIVGAVERGVQNSLWEQCKIRFAFTDEVWQDTLSATAHCHALIDKLTKG